MERIACRLVLVKRKRYIAGDGLLVWPCEKMGVEGEAEVGCCAWKWLL